MRINPSSLPPSLLACRRPLGRFAPAARGIVAAGLLLGGAAPALRAVLWQSDHWALTAAAEGGLGYDSNLLASAGGDGDSYVVAAPAFSLQRLNSLTLLQADFTLRSYSYLDRRDFDSVDPSLVIRLRFPYDQESPATQEFEARASRRSDANRDVGGRLRHDDVNVRWEGTYTATGKIRLIPRLEIRRTDYLTAGYNTNEGATAGFTAAFVANERLQLGAGYDFDYNRSRPDNPAAVQTDSRAHQFTLRGQGEFLPKVTGRFYLGASHNDYRGFVTRTDVDFIAGVSLAWQATARGQLAGKADRLNYFSPDGSTSTRSGVGLEWTHEIAGGFTATLGAEAAKVLYRYTTRTRKDYLYGGHIELRYALTERFSARLHTGYTTQDSNETFGNYKRTTVLASLTARF